MFMLSFLVRVVLSTTLPFSALGGDERRSQENQSSRPFYLDNEADTGSSRSSTIAGQPFGSEGGSRNSWDSIPSLSEEGYSLSLTPDTDNETESPPNTRRRTVSLDPFSSLMEPEKENGQNRRGVFQADAKTKDDRASTRKIISPVVYRYYGRKKSRTHASGSVPFILLGPNVDHWKVTSQELAKRGFNVIAVGPRDEESAIRHAERREEGPDLILQLMEALKWNKVVLVGCDTESTLAIQAAMELSPDRVVGLILCGQLESAENVFDPHHRNVHGKFALDHFLHGVLRCPFTVVWGGDGAQSAPSTKPSEGHSTADPAEDHRYLVIGGGSAPHRRRPELFAWILTRFVEKKIAPAIDVKGGTQRRYIGNRKRSTTGQGPVIDLPWHIQDIFNEESFIVFGRVAATALFYIMAVKVLFYQYDNFVLTVGMVSSARQRAFKTMQSAWDSLLLAKQNVFASISHLFALLGSPLFYFRKSRTMEQAEEQSKESVPTEHKEISDEPEDDRTQDKEEGDEDDVETEEVRPSSFLDHVIA